ncbi:WD repeat-containing protein 86-like [Eriocheir sinensis]|uniref:WD repeat-containing protein 86-like n=1 Tax=Eriocheir sinensis TaxID=95602 RepID=UPI0021C95E7E|nr:WD repeat-containing protein 86-like [Eriocheir sinensis]
MGSGISKGGNGLCKRRRKGKEGHLLETLKEHKGSINCAVLSDDNSLLVTGSDDGTARLWSALTDPTECLGVLSGHDGRVTCVAISQGLVFTGGVDTTIRKWDMVMGECLFVYTGHVQQIHHLLTHNELLFSTSYDKTARVWMIDADELMTPDEICIRVFEGHQRAVYPMLFIPGHDTGITDEDGLHINPGDTLITGSTDTTARSWSLDMDICLKVYKHHRGAITCMDRDPTGRFLYTGSHDCTVIVWNILSAKCLRVLEGHKDGITCVKVVNRLMYTGSADSTVRCWVREFGDCTRTYKQSNGEASVVCLGFESGALFVGYTDCLVRAFDAKSSTLRREFRGHTEAVNHMVLNGGRLYTTSSDGALKVWDASGIGDEAPNTPEHTSDAQHPDLDLDLDDYLRIDEDEADNSSSTQ